jgi:16S rRNA (guanine527-N7)-methyltransferase
MTSVDEQGFSAALNVSHETMTRLERYATLLEKWNPAINLVSRASLADLWTRHFLDSAQIFALRPKGARSWVDLGSGGGFPGLVVAVLAAEAAPDLRVTLVESDSRKAAFLATAAHDLRLSVTVKAERIEKLAPLGGDVVSARALAPLTDLLGYTARHLARGGRALFLKGATYPQELAAALAKWSFDVHTYPSRTDAAGVVLSIGDISHV